MKPNASGFLPFTGMTTIPLRCCIATSFKSGSMSNFFGQTPDNTLHTPSAEGPLLYLKARVDQNRKNDGSVGGDFQTYKPEGEVKKVKTAFVK